MWARDRVLVFALVLVGCDAASQSAAEVDASVDTATVDTGGADSEAPAEDTGGADEGSGDAFVLPVPPTTVEATVRGVLPESEQDPKSKTQFGLTEPGPGEPWIERDELDASQSKQGTSDGDPISLLFIVQLSDTHIIDEESPLRLIQYDGLVPSAYRMNEMFNGQVLDAMVRTIDRLADHYRPFDAVAFTGDLIDNNQQNELGWFLDIVEGRIVDPDSGADDDPLPGPSNDASDPFQAQGLRADIPWLAVVGNHDQLVQGTVSAIWPNGLPDASILDWFPGVDALVAPDDGCFSTCFDFSATSAEQLQMIAADLRSEIALGTQAEAAVHPTVAPVAAGNIGSGEVVSDPRRQLLTLNQWIDAFLQSPSLPAGHGMTQSNLDQDSGSYVYDPVAGLPIRIIALETVSKTLADGSALGTLRRATFDEFLVPQLDRALQDGVLVVLLSHHQSWGFAPAGLFTPHPLQSDKRDVAGKDLVETLASYPNVILHLVGHGHHNRIEAHPADDGSGAPAGYWEVETCAASFWPQQGRIIEVVDNRDGTGTIYSTMLDFDIPPVDVPGWPHRHIAAQGRFYGLYEVQMGLAFNGPGDPVDRNVLLHFVMPDAIRSRIEKLHADGTLAGREVQSVLFGQ